MGSLSTAAPVRCLTRKSLEWGVREICKTDRNLNFVVERFGVPPLWARRPGFATLVRIILEQQVSLASAHAIYRRLADEIGPVTPHTVAAAGFSGLTAIGFTRQKANYCYEIAVEIVAGTLDLSLIGGSDDERAREQLLSIRGVGPWTADIYRLMALRRPDVWPDGDLALSESVRVIKGLSVRPSIERLRCIAHPWRPWRSVAARILWHHYLSARREPPPVGTGS